MANIQCYGCQECGNYKRDCPKIKKDNNKIGREESHITKKWRKLKRRNLRKRK